MAAELYDAILRDNVTRFREVVQQDPYLVESASFACSRNVLHIAILWKRVAIVEELLKINPQLARDLDSQQSSPLHIAAAEGSLEIVKKLLPVTPEACWWRDCHDMNPIHIAAMNGHDEVLKVLLEESHMPAMERLHRGQTVFHLCVKHGQLMTLKVLVEKLGELVYEKDDNGETFLDLAVRCNQDEMVQHLVAMENNNIKVLVDLVDEVSYARSRNFLQIAILRGHVDMVEGLLNTNPQLARDLDSQQSSPLHIAVAKGSLEIVKKLLSVAPEACWWRDCHDMNPIHIAAMNGHVDILEELLQESPLPAMERLHRAQTVFHLCVKHGQLMTLKVLVEKLGELVYAKDDNGETFLDLAVRCNQDEMVQHLVAMENNNIKVLVDLVDEVSYARSRNFLQIAILRGHEAMVEGLLNTNPHLARDLDSRQSSPLHIAAAERSLEGNVVIVRKLLAVAPEACWWRDCHDMNPIHIAAMNGHVNILKELLERSHMPAMERLHRGQTVLHLCVKHGQLKTLEVLVEKLGDFVYAVDDDRETLLHLAVRCNQLEILRYLWKSNKIIKRKRNSMGKTALQILDESPPATTPSYSEMRRILRCIPAEYMFETNMYNVMMVVAILIATMAFQNSVTPPGGVWQDDTPSHKAGEAVIAYTHPDIYGYLVLGNNMAFYFSFFVILLITSGLTSLLPFISVFVGLAMWCSIVAIMWSYERSMKVISPNTFDTPLIGYYIISAGIIIAMLLGFLRAFSWAFHRLSTRDV